MKADIKPLTKRFCSLIIAAFSSELSVLNVHNRDYQVITANWRGNGTLLQYSCLANPMDGGAWWAAVHGVAKSQTRLSDFTFTFHFHALEKEIATHSSVLAWRIPGTGEPGGLPSLGSHRVGHDKQLSSSSSRVGKGNQTCLPFSVYGITFTFPWYGWWFSPDGLSLPF